jgi:ATP-dependent Clp protease ATP-binding subunit ClpA
LKTPPMDAFPLKHYGHNLTHVARQGVFSPLVGYEALVARIFQILLRRGKDNHLYNPLLLDLDEGRRWQVVIEVVRRIAAGEAPESFPIREVIALNYEALFAKDAAPHRRRTMEEAQRPSPDDSEWERALADAASEEMFEQFVTKYFSGGLWPELEEWNAPYEVLSRLQELFLAVRQSEGQILLFVDHVHWLVGGDQQRYQIDASGLLKAVLARREIQLIGACTPAEYQQYIERDAAISRRMQEFEVRSDEELQEK